MVAAKAAAPPSARSSRATAVTHGEAQAPSARRPRRPARARPGRAARGRRGVDQAEAAGPRAALAVDHEGGGAVGPALEDVRAAGLLAHRDQVEVAHRRASGAGSRAHRRGLDPQPVGLALDRAGSRIVQPRPPAGRAAAPAGRIRRSSRAAGDGASRASPRVNAARSSGATARRRRRGRRRRGPTADGVAGDRVDDLAHGDVDALGGERGHAELGDAARDDVVEHARSVARSARSRASSDRVEQPDADRGDLRGGGPSSAPTQTPG